MGHYFLDIQYDTKKMLYNLKCVHVLYFNSINKTRSSIKACINLFVEDKYRMPQNDGYTAKSSAHHPSWHLTNTVV